MSHVHVVEAGEHLSGIAARFGFSSFRSLWHHPQNAALRSLRKNPHVLFAGDRVFIPDRETREETRPTDQKHRFVAPGHTIVLRVKVLDLQDNPRPEPCMLSGNGFQVRMVEEGGSVLTAPIPVDARKAELFFPNTDKEESAVKVPVAVGFLDPITEEAGQRQRLNNLGYFAGFDAGSKAQFKWAVQEFQCDHLKEVRKKKEDGKCDAATQAALEKVHGV